MRIFEEKHFNIVGKVLPFDAFKPFSDMPNGFTVNPDHYPEIISRAENLLTRDFPMLIASDYMMYKRDGNRSIYEGKCFSRRDAILNLSLAEYVEKKGRFTDKIIDLLWMILEETSWVIPAHNPGKAGLNTCLPYAYKEDADYIDLFSATTGATLAVVYFLMKDEFDKVTTILNDRLLYELNTRIVKPFLNIPACWEKMWWTGLKGNGVNNWCPWIVSNVLTVCAFTVKDQATREAIVYSAMPMLDNFTSVYHPDGGCDEGPGYWGAAGGALFNATLVLYDLTGGYVDISDSQLFKNMGEYEVKVCVNADRFLNFADCASKNSPNPILVYDWGKRVGSEMMMTYGQNRLNGGLPSCYISQGQPYQNLKNVVFERLPVVDFKAPTKFFIDGICVAGSRESMQTDKGLYVALKGGSNGESHNHNDIGNIIVFADGKPLFMDAGAGSYTAKTFSRDRYTIWSMTSAYHNVATVNGVDQAPGGIYYSTDHNYDKESGKLTIQLSKAYPASAGIVSYKKSAVLKDSVVTVEDDISLENEGSVIFNFLVCEKPTEEKNNSFVVAGRTVTYDPDLEYSIEECDKTAPETKTIWSGYTLYRIRLASKTAFKDKKFTLTVK